MNRIRLLTLCFCVSALAGCGTTSRQVIVRHYDLAAVCPAVPPGPIMGKVLRVTDIHLPPWLQGDAMYYRLDYRHGHAIAAYANSDWVASPASMLGELVRNTLADDGTWQAVLGPADPVGSDFSLHIEIDDFSQVFTSISQSHARLDATATLIDDSSGTVISQRRFVVREAAPRPDAEGGVEALRRASRQFAGELQRWLLATRGRLNLTNPEPQAH